jgi:hypothetical protein
MTRSQHQNIVLYVLHVGVLNGESEAMQAVDWQDKNAQENAMYNFVHLEMVPSLYDSLLFMMIYRENLQKCF